MDPPQNTHTAGAEAQAQAALSPAAAAPAMVAPSAGASEAAIEGAAVTMMKVSSALVGISEQLALLKATPQHRCVVMSVLVLCAGQVGQPGAAVLEWRDSGHVAGTTWPDWGCMNDCWAQIISSGHKHLAMPFYTRSCEGGGVPHKLRKRDPVRPLRLSPASCATRRSSWCSWGRSSCRARLAWSSRRSSQVSSMAACQITATTVEIDP